MKTFAVSIASIALFALLGCQKKDTQSAQEASPGEETGSREVVLLTMAEYFSPDVISRFEAESGVKLRQVIYDNLGQMMGMIRSNPDEYDLVTTDDLSVGELAKTKRIAAIDRDSIPNFKNLDPRYLDQRFDPGNQFSVPYVWGTTLIAYRTDKIENPPRSWDLLWDKSHKGRIAMMDEPADLYAIGLLRSGYSLNSQELAELDSATDALVEQAKTVEPVYSELFDIRDLLLAGKISAAIIYSCDGAMLAEEDENIAYFIPEEGAPLWLDNFAILREAPNPDAAHEFINYMCQPEVAAENANYVWYKPPVLDAEKWMNEDLVGDESLNPPESVLAKCEFYHDVTVMRANVINQGMKKILDQLRGTSQLVEANQ